MGNRFGLPGISSKLPADVRQFLERVGEFIRTGDFASRRDLVDWGLAKYDQNGNIIPPDEQEEVVDLSPPPAPTGLTATGAMTTIILTWDDPTAFYGNFAFTEVWRSATNNLGTAVLQGTTRASVYSDAVGGAATFFYWIRFVSRADIAGPYNGTEGTVGATAPDPGYLLDQLTGQITTTQLHATLGERITAIGAVEAEIDTINATLADIEGTPEYDPLVTYLADQLVKYNGALYQAVQTTTGNLPTNTTFWTKVGDYASLGDAVAAHALQLTDHETRITSTEGGLTAETTARQTLATQVRGNYTGTDVVNVSSGLFFSERTLRSTADATEVTARQALSAKITGLNDPSAATLGSLTSGLIYDERTVRASADQAIADDVTLLSTTVGGHTTSISTQQTSINGLSAQYTVKVDNNGYVSGFGLASNPVNDVPFSDFIIRADRFSVSSPTGPGIDPIIPFVVTTTPTTIGGEAVPVGVYMNAAFIQNGTITRAKIGAAAIDDAKIANLDAAKITAGHITADRMQANIVSALTGKFATLSALTSLLGTVTIDPAGWLRTNGVTGYAVGTGFFLGYEGGAYKFRVGTTTLHMAWDGTKAIIGNPTGGRLEATDTGITVYDSAGAVTLSSGGNLDWAKILSRPTNLTELNTTDGTKLSGIAGGATVGAPTGTLVGGTLAQTVEANASTALANANTALTNAATAQTSANTANNLLADIASDSKLTASEKQQTKVEWDGIVAEKAGINAQATAFGITTENTNYNNAYNTLSDYITPLLSSLTTTSNIVGTTFRTNFSNLYSTRQALLNKIAAEAGTRADWAIVSGAGKPENNATVGAIIGTNLVKAAGGNAVAADFVATWNHITAANITTYIDSLAVGSTQIATAAIIEAKIADAAITTAKIDDAAITTAKIDDAAITTAKIGTAQIDTLQLAGGAVSVSQFVSATDQVFLAEHSQTTVLSVSVPGVEDAISGIVEVDFHLGLGSTKAKNWWPVEVRIYRGATIIWSKTGSLSEFLDETAPGFDNDSAETYLLTGAYTSEQGEWYWSITGGMSLSDVRGNQRGEYSFIDYNAPTGTHSYSIWVWIKQASTTPYTWVKSRHLWVRFTKR